MRGATVFHRPVSGTAEDFNPRTPCGVRRIFIYDPTRAEVFQSTHPMRGATAASFTVASTMHFNPRTPCGVRPATIAGDLRWDGISIHAPHAGCDFLTVKDTPELLIFQSTHPMRGATEETSFPQFGIDISIHAPHAGCDVVGRYVHQTAFLFQSTHPMRGATAGFPVERDPPPYFNPRTPCGVRPLRRRAVCRRQTDFNPRTPCGVRRYGRMDKGAVVVISIHAPHAGCDVPKRRPILCSSYFNPRTPCGVRRIQTWQKQATCNFNPRTPCGVRPLTGADLVAAESISIHAPHAGCDVRCTYFC